MKIVIVDYGMGNLKSISSVFKYLGAGEVIISSEYNQLQSADRIVLPGVGSFGKAIREVKGRKLDQHLKELSIGKKKPLLGICLGMQLMGLSSTEDGFNEGLGFAHGVVTKFDSDKMKVPHVGFNQVRVKDQLKLYEGLSDDVDFYFTHSYKMLSDENINQCECNYHGNFIASFEMDNIAGVQFHPELSQNNGLTLLKNFMNNF